MVFGAAERAQVPVDVLLALLIAESALNPYAQRFGRRTREAVIAMEKEDWSELHQIISDTWPDISFGMGQRIVLYHWWGDTTSTVSNVLNVRKAVFGQPERDILEAAMRLRNGWDAARNMTEREIKALIHYNAGHIPAKGSAWWITWAENAVSYRLALREAREQLGEPE